MLSLLTMRPEKSFDDDIILFLSYLEKYRYNSDGVSTIRLKQVFKNKFDRIIEYLTVGEPGSIITTDNYTRIYTDGVNLLRNLKQKKEYQKQLLINENQLMFNMILSLATGILALEAVIKILNSNEILVKILFLIILCSCFVLIVKNGLFRNNN